MRYVRIAVSLLLLVGAAYVVARETDWALVSSTFTRISWAAFVLTILALLAGALLATLRLQWIARDLGYRLSFRDAMAGFTYGQVLGAVFFQLAGQLLARSTVLARRQVPPAATILITGYERLAALFISLLLATVAAGYLFGAISLDYRQGGSAFIKTVAGGALVVAGGAVFVWGRLLISQSLPITRHTVGGLARNAAISLGIQIFTMIAYVVLARALVPDISIAKLAAAAALVMLAASLPISMAGWGIREMSAIYVLGTLGVSADVSFMIAFSIGILSLAVVGALALVGLRDTAATAKSHVPSAHSTNYSALLDTVLPITAATAVFFQLFLPVNSGLISVNLADPIVIVGGCIFAYNHFRQSPPRWRLPHFNILICLATFTVVAAYLHGHSQFGWTQWAFANKLVGWPILLCYGATGALIVYRLRDAGLELLLRAFVATSLIVFLFDYAISIAYWSGAVFLKPIVHFPIEGFSQNRNALSFQLVLTICILLATRWPHKSVWLGIAIAGVTITGSRAGYVTLAAVLVVSMFVASINWRQVVGAAGLAALIIIASELIPTFVHFVQTFKPVWTGWFGTPGGDFGPAGSSYVASMMSGSGSDHERLQSLQGGWNLFLTHPIFGAGLGAFMEEQVRRGTALVIHSTPLWILAEFGIVGFFLLSAPVVLIFRAEILNVRQIDVAGCLLILVITAFCVMSLAHEILYQRTFWILLGAAMAMPRMLTPASPGQTARSD
jgi:O-antigen ligase